MFERFRIAFWALLVGLALCVAVAVADDPQPAGTGSGTWIKGDIPNVKIPQVEADLMRLRGLKFKQQVPVDVKHEDEMRAYMQDSFEKDAADIENEACTLRAFGCLAPRFDLKEALIDDYTHSILGFYEPATKHFYVAVDAHTPPKGADAAFIKSLGLTPEDITTAHEMDHALQDQYFDLTAVHKTISGMHNSDRFLAAKALIEGEATWVMYDVMFDRMGIPAVTMPTLRDQIQESESRRERDAGTSKLPLLLKRAQLFPYIEGAGFVHNLRRLAPDWDLVNKTWSDLPDSTQQIMHPFLYIGHRLFPTDIKFKSLPAEVNGWIQTDDDTMGEYLSGILLDNLLGETESEAHRKLATAWIGDRYRVYRKGDTQALVWFATWKDEAGAREIERALRSAWSGTPEAAAIPLRMERHGSDLVVTRGLAAEDQAAFWPAASDVERQVKSHPVAVELNDEELVRREEAASKLKPDQAKLNKILSAMPLPQPRSSDFRQYGVVWRSLALSISFTPPPQWQFTSQHLPPTLDLIGECKQPQSGRLIIQRLPGTQDTVERLEAAITKELSRDLPNLKISSRRPISIKGLSGLEVHMDSETPVSEDRIRVLHIMCVFVRHRGHGIMFCFMGGRGEDMRPTFMEMMDTVEFL